MLNDRPIIYQSTSSFIVPLTPIHQKPNTSRHNGDEKATTATTLLRRPAHNLVPSQHNPSTYEDSISRSVQPSFPSLAFLLSSTVRMLEWGARPKDPFTKLTQTERPFQFANHKRTLRCRKVSANEVMSIN